MAFSGSFCWSGWFTAGWPAAGERRGYSPAVTGRPPLPGRAAAGPPPARHAPVPGGAFRARTMIMGISGRIRTGNAHDHEPARREAAGLSSWHWVRSVAVSLCGQAGAGRGGDAGLGPEVAGEAGAGGDAELTEGVAEVGFHGGLGDEEVLGDLAVGQAVGGQGGDAAFGAGQGVGAGQGGAAGTGTDGEEFLADLGGQGSGAGALG